MCGRFNLRTSAEAIAQCFLPGFAAGDLPEISSRYNIAPTQQIAGVYQPEGSEQRQLTFFRWGLLPPWADDFAIGSRMINARSETVAEKKSFKGPLQHRRCLIPASGYYEWKKQADGKQPFEFARADGSLLALAGLWERNSKADPDGNKIYSCTILTTQPNALAAEVHDRMPVLLDPSAIDDWLDPACHDLDRLQSLLQPAPDDWLTKRPVNKRLGNVKNDGAELLEP